MLTTETGLKHNKRSPDLSDWKNAILASECS